MPSISANGCTFHYERSGSGPSLLFIGGAGGDAELFARVAELLSDEFTVITYDRRGNSRTSRPDGWTATTLDEQADDAAALLSALQLAPAVVYGNSTGAIIALDLLLRHRGAVRGAILHEPPLVAVLANPQETQNAIGAVVEEGMAKGGPPAAMEHFMRWACSDASWDSFSPALKERIRANGETFFGIEIGRFEPYRPEQAALASVSRVARVLTSDQSAPFFAEAARWLAAGLGVDVMLTPGTHTPHLDHPRELVDNIRPVLRSFGAA